MNQRREFLKKSILLGASMTVSPYELFAYRLPVDRKIKLYNIHTGEHLKATYWSKDHFVKSELHKINHFLRDYRTGETQNMDIKLLDLLYSIQLIRDTSKPFQVVSGYRSPKTNEMLRRRSEGVAKNSFHLKARAIDINLPGTELKDLKKLAKFLQRGGVGYYPKSGFMHIDTGPIRYWKRG
jgi:uncharacterized protein YcbK (DUF882 family)